MNSNILLAITALLIFSGCVSDSQRPLVTDGEPKKEVVKDEVLEAIKTTEELTEIADRILDKARGDNIAAAKEVEVVFQAAEKLRKESEFKKARLYFEKGLELSPWNMDAQLSFAKTLLQLNETEKAKQSANLVLRTSERELLLKEAARITGVEFPVELQRLPDKRFEKTVICFVPIGPVQDWIITKAGHRLGDTLGVEVYQYAETLLLPEPHRSYFKRWTENLKKDITWEHPWVIEQMKDIGISDVESADTNQVLELLARIEVVQGGEDPRPRFQDMICSAKERDQQWDAAVLIDDLTQQIRRKRGVLYVGVTEADMFTNNNNYLFGLARTGGGVALISYCRYQAWFHRERENQNRLLDRVHKQLLSSSGFALGIPRPKDPRSARSYPNGLNDHDLKGTWLAPECIAGFEEFFGHALPEKTKQASNQRE